MTFVQIGNRQYILYSMIWVEVRKDDKSPSGYEITFKLANGQEEMVNSVADVNAFGMYLGFSVAR